MQTHSISKLPALFIGHGAPTNAITDNPFRKQWQKLGDSLPRPRVILCISAHWETSGTQVCTAVSPRTIHDFGGFPKELYEQLYPAPGAPDDARAVQALFPSGRVSLNEQWGLDHGAWSILQSLFPAADVPVFQLSLNTQFTPAQHFTFAKQLAVLRTQGFMIIGSGNIVHNLRMINHDFEPPSWATEFNDYVRDALLRNDRDALIDYSLAGASATLAVPSNEHYLPLLYIAALRSSEDQLQFFNDGYDWGSISMLSVVVD